MSREFTLTEISNALFNMVRLGVVSQISSNGKRVKVSYKGVPGAWLQWGEESAGEVRTWNPPVLGEQVVLLAPEGDTRHAIIIKRLNRDSFDSPFNNPKIHGVKYSDGAEIYYDREEKELHAYLPGGGKVDLIAPGGFNLIGDIYHDGNFYGTGNAEFGGTIKSDGDQIAAGLSQLHHGHMYKPGPGSPIPSSAPVMLG